MKLNRKTRWRKVRRRRIEMCRRFATEWVAKYRDAKEGKPCAFPQVLLAMMRRRVAYWTLQTADAVMNRRTPIKKSRYRTRGAK